MSLFLSRGLATALRVLGVAAVFGLPGIAAADRPEPTRVDADVPPLKHRSVLQRYRPLGETPPKTWRAANDEVAHIGGWRAYLREAAAPEPAPAPQAASSAPELPLRLAPPPHSHGRGGVSP